MALEAQQPGLGWESSGTGTQACWEQSRVEGGWAWTGKLWARVQEGQEGQGEGAAPCSEK